MAQCPSLNDLPITLPPPPVPPPVGLQFEEMDYTVEDGGFSDLLNQTVGNAGDDTDGFDAMFADVSTAADSLQTDLLGFDPDLNSATQAGATDSAFDAASVNQAADDASNAIGAATDDLGGQLGIVPAPPTPPTQPVPPGGNPGGGTPPPPTLPPCTETLGFGQVTQFDPPTSADFQVNWAKLGNENNSFPSVRIANDPQGLFSYKVTQVGELTKVEVFNVTFTLNPTFAGQITAEAQIFSNSAAGLEWDVCLTANIVPPPPPPPKTHDLTFPDTALFATSAPLNPYDNTLGNPNYLSDAPQVIITGDTYGQFAKVITDGPVVNGVPTKIVSFTFTGKVAGPATAHVVINPILGASAHFDMAGTAVNTGQKPAGVTFTQEWAVTDFTLQAGQKTLTTVLYYPDGPTDAFVSPTFTIWNDPLGQLTVTAMPFLQLDNRYEYVATLVLTTKQPGPIDIWVTIQPNLGFGNVLAMHVTGTLT